MTPQQRKNVHDSVKDLAFLAQQINEVNRELKLEVLKVISDKIVVNVDRLRDVLR